MERLQTKGIPNRSLVSDKTSLVPEVFATLFPPLGFFSGMASLLCSEMGFGFTLKVLPDCDDS